MTPAEIAALPAGPELDALVDRLVMGHAAGELCDGGYMEYDTITECMMCAWATNSGQAPHEREAPAYSTTWGAAGEVIAHMKEQGAYWEINSYSLGWSAACWWQGRSGGYRNGETAPLAICRAALLAVQGGDN